MNCKTHDAHSHTHGANCGHKAIEHEGHTDYIHDGHLHHVHNDHIDEHVLGGGTSTCTPDHTCRNHDQAHKHGANCGHASLPHNGHTDYLVHDHLHHPCAQHCDDHGAVAVR